MSLISKAPAGVFGIATLLWGQHSFAANLYVDGSCPVDGNGLADACASAAGGAGAWRGPQSCFSNAHAGDTCLIKNGTYVTTNQGGGDPSESGGFSVASSGTAAQPIVFRNYPGHAPLLTNCAVTDTAYASCARPTITAPLRQYITLQGLRIHGGIWIYGVSYAVGQGSRGIVLRDLEITQGWGEVADGNWAAMFLAGLTGAVVQNNYVHSVAVLTGGGQQSSGSGIKLYFNTDSVIEQNTIRTVTIPESQAGGIDDKDQAVRNIIRYNRIEDVNTCVRVNSGYDSTGDRIYGNECIGQQRGYAARPGIRLLVNINDIAIYNNTISGFGQGLMTEAGPITNARWYNNIVANLTAGANTEIYSAGLVAPTNYNTWAPGGRFQYPGGNYAGLAAWSAASGFDQQSSEGDCSFVSATDLHLRPGSPCIGAGRLGGVSSGTPVDRGAYGVTACVGHACGAPEPADAGSPAADAGTAGDSGGATDGSSADADAGPGGETANVGVTVSCSSSARQRGQGPGFAFVALALAALACRRPRRRS